MSVLAVTKERRAGETRVAVTPDAAKKLIALGFEVVVEAGAGLAAAVRDADYEAAGARIVPDAAAALKDADVVLKVRGLSEAEIGALKPGAIVVGLFNPHQDRALTKALTEQGATVFAMELVPR